MVDLYTITGEESQWDESYKYMNDVVKDEVWDVEVLKTIILEDLVQHIINNIKVSKLNQVVDRAYWKLNATGKFTVKSAWQYIRYKEEENEIYIRNWVKELLFKFSFFMWRLWKFKVPVDDRIRKWGIHGPSKCWCCDIPDQETMSHVFLR